MNTTHGIFRQRKSKPTHSVGHFFFFFNIPLKTGRQSNWLRTWGAGMHLGTLKLSDRNLHIQRPRLLSQALTSRLSCDRKSNWRVIADYPVSAHCSGGSCQDQTSQECLGPLVLIFPFVGGKRLEVAVGQPSSFLPPNWTLPVRCHQARVSTLPTPRDIR